MLFCDGRTFREEKTSHPNVLRLGKTHEFAESSLVLQLSWERRIPCLKKPLSHFDVDHCPDSTELLLSQIHSIVHMSNENLQRAVRKGDWHNPFSALRVLNSYVAGSWFWLSPLLQPLHKHLSSVRVLQVTFLVLMLGLSLPDAYAHDPEMHLPTLPGRISLFCSCTRRNKTGVIIWVQRRLNCLGHVLRCKKGFTYGILGSRKKRNPEFCEPPLGGLSGAAGQARGLCCHLAADVSSSTS